MALSYYYNFILPTAANLRDKEEEEPLTPIDMEVERGKFQDFTLTKGQLLVFVPRSLDGSDMKVFLRNISQEKKVLQGKPKERPGKGTHRPMFVYFLDWNEEKKTCNGLFDLPTIISSIWDRAQDEIKNHHAKEKEVRENIEKEILDFQNKLHELVSNSVFTKKCVRIISMPSLPFEFNKMKEVALEILEKDVALPTKTIEKKDLKVRIQEFKWPSI